MSYCLLTSETKNTIWIDKQKLRPNMNRSIKVSISLKYHQTQKHCFYSECLTHSLLDIPFVNVHKGENQNPIMLKVGKEENTVFMLHLKPNPRMKQSPTAVALHIKCTVTPAHTKGRVFLFLFLCCSNKISGNSQNFLMTGFESEAFH